MLIARRLRELGYFSEILPFTISMQEIAERNPAGIILSGGPNSVYDEGSPHIDVKKVLEIAPVLGICYGMQLICQHLGGVVKTATHREYGLKQILWKNKIANIPEKQNVWMSHGDVVEKVPEGFQILASTDQHPAAISGKNILAFQFHPEVSHTEFGTDCLKYFIKEYCQIESNWTSKKIKDDLIEKLKSQVPAGEKVLSALSGGVDSTVCSVLLTEALGVDRVKCVFVDSGLLRKNEFTDVLESYKRLGLNVEGVQASDEFLAALKGKSDPEEKRKAIGRTFIEIFDATVKRQSVAYNYLAQGTLYPDVIESISSQGKSVTIKSHHNVGGLPEKMKMKLVEPLRELFKDEVRRLGAELKIPQEFLGRHPFPGPGLAIRILGEVTLQRLQILKEADHIWIQFLREKKLYDQIWQAFCVLLPVQTVGVMGDGRTYESVLALRAVTSLDGMTADWFSFQTQDLREVSSRITNQVRGINRVVYDITSKPPATIEWE